jgi:hypothetical protein
MVVVGGSGSPRWARWAVQGAPRPLARDWPAISGDIGEAARPQKVKFRFRGIIGDIATRPLTGKRVLN